MGFLDFYTSFIDDFLPTVTKASSDILDILGSTIGELANTIGVNPERLPPALGNLSLFACILGAGAGTIIIYSLVKWILDIVL